MGSASLIYTALGLDFWSLVLVIHFSVTPSSQAGIRNRRHSKIQSQLLENIPIR